MTPGRISDRSSFVALGTALGLLLAPAAVQALEAVSLEASSTAGVRINRWDAREGGRTESSRSSETGSGLGTHSLATSHGPVSTAAGEGASSSASLDVWIGPSGLRFESTIDWTRDSARFETDDPFDPHAPPRVTSTRDSQGFGTNTVEFVFDVRSFSTYRLEVPRSRLTADIELIRDGRITPIRIFNMVQGQLVSPFLVAGPLYPDRYTLRIEQDGSPRDGFSTARFGFIVPEPGSALLLGLGLAGLARRRART